MYPKGYTLFQRYFEEIALGRKPPSGCNCSANMLLWKAFVKEKFVKLGYISLSKP
jgi:hypothetical protein